MTENILGYTCLGHSKSKMIFKLHHWLNSYGDFNGLGVFCIVVECHRGRSVNNGAAPYREY